LKQVKDLSIFLLGEHIYLQIKMIAPLCKTRFVILADQDKCREKDGFE